MLRATRCRSGFSPLLSVRALLSRCFCATAIFESDASPPDPLVHFSQQLHTSDHDQHRTTNGIFHPVKSHRLPPAFRPCPPVCEQTERTVTEAGSPQWRFSAVPHATFSPCRTLRFHAVRASKRTQGAFRPFAPSACTVHAAPDFPAHAHIRQITTFSRLMAALRFCMAAWASSPLLSAGRYLTGNRVTCN